MGVATLEGHPLQSAMQTITRAMMLVLALVLGLGAEAADKKARAENGKVTEAPVAPRAGKYGIYSYGATPNRLYLGDIELAADGSYRALQPGGKLLGEGKYRFDAAKSAVIWLSGPYQSSEWAG